MMSISRADVRWRRGLRLYVLLAAICIGIQTLLLTLIPVVVVQTGGSPGNAGILVALYASIGIVSDNFVGRSAYRFGIRKTILTGATLSLIGIVLIAVSREPVGLISAVVLSGIATSFQMIPVLGGLSSHAGTDQVRAQGTNIMAQRSGALIASFFLGRILSEGGNYSVAIGALTTLVVALAVLCMFLKQPARKSDSLPRVANEPRKPTLTLFGLVKSSPLMRTALIVNVTSPLLTVFGASFFPLILIQLAHPELLAASLVGREVVAVGVAAVARRINRRKFLTVAWAGFALIGVAGIVAAMFVSSPALIVILFSLHGGSISSGIMMSNVCVYDSTDPTDRMLGFAATSIFSRISSLLFPIILGLVGNISVQMIAYTVVVIVLLTLTSFWIVSRSRRQPAVGLGQ